MPHLKKTQQRLGSDPFADLSWIRDSRAGSTVLPAGHPPQRGNPALPNAAKTQERPPAARGCREGWTRVTFIIREEYREKLRAVAWWQRRQLKDVLDAALTEYLEKNWKKGIPQK